MVPHCFLFVFSSFNTNVQSYLIVKVVEFPRVWERAQVIIRFTLYAFHFCVNLFQFGFLDHDMGSDYISS